MDPYDSPLRSPKGSPKRPFLHSLLGTRERMHERLSTFGFGAFANPEPYKFEPQSLGQALHLEVHGAY